jgi:hypothetical protein
MSTSFREPESPKPKVADETRDGSRTEVEVGDLKPVETDQDILEALGVADDIKILPEEDYQDLQELKSYLNAYMQDKGLPQTVRGVQKGIESLKKEFGLHEEADFQAIIKRIGGIARSWREISFIRDVDEKKRILIKLISASSDKEMNSIVFDEMEKRKVWQQ